VRVWNSSKSTAANSSMVTPSAGRRAAASPEHRVQP